MKFVNSRCPLASSWVNFDIRMFWSQWHLSNVQCKTDGIEATVVENTEFGLHWKNIRLQMETAIIHRALICLLGAHNTIPHASIIAPSPTRRTTCKNPPQCPFAQKRLCIMISHGHGRRQLRTVARCDSRSASERTFVGVLRNSDS